MEEGARISKSMIIHGNIMTSEDIVIDGTVIGDIEFEKDLILHGTVEGNIVSTGTGDSILDLCQGAVVIGDIHGKDVSVSGAVKGLVCAEKHLDVMDTAIIQGDLKAATMQINNGSAIEGMLKINPDNRDISKVFEI